jgi:hypothetical protein
MDKETSPHSSHAPWYKRLSTCSDGDIASEAAASYKDLNNQETMMASEEPHKTGRPQVCCRPVIHAVPVTGTFGHPLPKISLGMPPYAC